MILSCQSDVSERKPVEWLSKTTPQLNEVIKTASGLEYYYEKMGAGQKIDSGYEVTTYLRLKVNDSNRLGNKQSPRFFIYFYCR